MSRPNTLSAAATLIAACAAAMPLAGPGSAATRPPTSVPDCLGKLHVRPAAVVLACADAGLGVRALHWLGWGAPTAAGLGIAYANDCNPTCAAGHFHTYRAVLLLSGSRDCGGRIAYRTATVAIVGRPPDAWATPADATYPLRCST